MHAAIRALGVGAVSILGAHALAYYLITFLPSPAVLLLGIFSAQTDAVQALQNEYTLPGYIPTVLALIAGDLGTTLDGTPVLRELVTALGQSLPRMIAVFAGAMMVGIGQSLWGKGGKGPWYALADFFIFVPAFVFPLGIMSLLVSVELIIGSLPTDVFRWIGCTVAMAIGPLSLTLIQVRAIIHNHLSGQYARRLLATGASDRVVRRRLLRNVVYELLPSIEKLMTMMLTFLVFAEFVFNVPGLGTQTIRAVTRADWALILAIVILFAFFVNVSRILSVLIRQRMMGH